MIVQTREVRKAFGRTEVLKGVSLQVPEGAAFALVGTNGAGKTTTMRLLINMLQADSGTASVLGCDSRKLSPAAYQQIGYVSENQILPERLTIAQYFDYLRALYPGWDRGLENTLRKRMQLPPSRRLGKLSHGMRMKTVLIAGLAFRPRLLILDEPLSGMDTLTRDEVVDGLLEQAEESTILISSHELSEIEYFTSHIAFMDDGNLCFQEEMESLHKRFRQVQVTLSARKDWPEESPPHWLEPELQGHSLRFVETTYAGPEELQHKLNSHFGAVQWQESPMSLREISKVLIRQARTQDPEAVA